MASLVTTPAASIVSQLMLQGRESAAVLEALLQDASPHEQAGVRQLAVEILRCCDRALAALHGGVDGVDAVTPASGRKRKSGSAGADAQTRPKKRGRASGEKAPAKRVEKNSTSEDGFIWRKYGQKEILNSKHPRLYFRCTYRDDNGCPATRQVQMSEDDPSLYVITYFSNHTCCADVAASATSEVEDLGEAHPFVINFGSAAASGGSPPWLSSPSEDGDGQSETSRSSSITMCSPEGDREEELRPKMARIEPTSSDFQPAAELSSSADTSCSSPAWDPLAACSALDCFDETSFDFDYVSEFLNYDGIVLYQ